MIMINKGCCLLLRVIVSPGVICSFVQITCYHILFHCFVLEFVFAGTLINCFWVIGRDGLMVLDDVGWLHHMTWINIDQQPSKTTFYSGIVWHSAGLSFKTSSTCLLFLFCSSRPVRFVHAVYIHLMKVVDLDLLKITGKKKKKTPHEKSWHSTIRRP